jgi:hypothetical protein
MFTEHLTNIAVNVVSSTLSNLLVVALFWLAAAIFKRPPEK